MPVPFIDLKRQEDGFQEAWIEKVAQLSSNTAFMGGPEVEQLESHIRESCQTEHAISCGNGTDALQIALRAAGVSQGDTVLLPDMTFWATFEAVVNCNAQAVTIDIDPIDLQMDFDLFQQAVDQYKPKAALLVHLYGWGSARLNDFRDYCQKNNVALIEDGAQAWGVKWQDESIYKNAYISTISFYPAKVYGAAGDAGAITTNNAELARRVRSISNHGRSQHYSYEFVGWNSRMDSLQAAYLNLVYPHLSERLNSRRQIANLYRKEIKASVTCVAAPEGYQENGYLNCLLIADGKRDQLTEVLKQNQIGYGIVYPEPMSEQGGAKGHLQARLGGEQSKRICQSVLNLPLFAYMQESEAQQVIDIVNQVL